MDAAPQQQENDTIDFNPTSHQQVVDEDWEEWDGRSPFWIHCVAGSLAGVAEHALVYPLDTVRTHIQVCASCMHKGKASSTSPLSSSLGKNASLVRSALKNSAAPTSSQLPTGVWQTIRYLVNEPAVLEATAAATTPQNQLAGFSRLWRGVQTMFIGCIPAHALYFSAYELVKSTSTTPEISPFTSSLAGAAAVTGHDLVMTPLDTMKQRIQLGHYEGSVQVAARQILRNEGWSALYRSFPITLASNIPYGMVMVSTHEACKQAWTEPGVQPGWQVVLAASSVAGFVASAVTTPLDRIKTSLQTQQLAPACLRGVAQKNCRRGGGIRHKTWMDASVVILKEEGAVGFFRGMCPRVLSHTPAVAISWTAYETLKHHLMVKYA